MIHFDPKLGELFSNNTGKEWDFSQYSEANGGDLMIMDYNSNPHFKFDSLPGFEQLEEYVKDALQKAAVYSRSEVQGWGRLDFENQRLIDMFGSETIYVPPSEYENQILFFKAMQEWFDGLPYGGEKFGDSPDEFAFEDYSDSVDLSYAKEYGLTSSLLSVFDSKD